MRKGPADRNLICLHGHLEGGPVLSHVNHGVEFFTLPLLVTRLSGAQDRLNVIASGPLLEQVPELGADLPLSVRGEVRTFNNRSGTGSRLVITAYARELAVQEREDENRLELSGTLCKPPSLRFTPLGRTICDMILAVNRRYGKADDRPCSAWGSLAHRCGELTVGDRVELNGRLQSRSYTKVVDDCPQERTAFEVSVMSLLPGGEEVLTQEE